MTPKTAAWQALWQALRPDNEYHEDWGFERAWREKFDTWGFPLESTEIEVEHGGAARKGRNFHKIGLVIWEPTTGCVVLGRPR